MKPFAHKLLAVSVGISIIAFFAYPLRAKAVIPPLLSYGGANIFSIPCTCSFSSWSFYAPLYLSSIPMAGPIAYVPGASWLFANFIPPFNLYADYEGAFLPGVQACWMYAGFFCFPLPSLGVTAFTGTGLPGSGAPGI
ncbi:MAG: hypothetical protein HZA81_04340 [Candidatus Taylorbacteria bacterium]|nr:hypothetical protein [Candidatus Taylorbacteria bacterium]